MAGFMSYGIDLGTTNSCVAQLLGSGVRFFPSSDRTSITPSVVHITRTGQRYVGLRARNRLTVDSENVRAEFKRQMGDKAKLEFRDSGQSLSAEELSAEVLRSLMEDVHRVTGEVIQEAVITVPAAFGALQCEATGRAAALAGLLQAPLLQEPIAAAVAYGAEPDAKDQRWLVFDLGGGTFDVAVVSTRHGQLAVLEHKGDNQLGGKDIDRGIVENLLIPVLRQEFRLPTLRDDPIGYGKLIRRLRFKAEEIKIDLSGASSITATVCDVGNDLDQTPIELDVEVQRQDIEREIDIVFQRTLAMTHAAIEGARISANDLDRVLLVGGPTQTPLIRAGLEDAFGAALDYSLDPMTVVAQGAALFAGTMESAGTRPQIVTTPRGARLALAYDPVTGLPRATVLGRVESGSVTEIKIDSDGGHFSSGWVRISDGLFEVDLALREGANTRFVLSGRDDAGRPVDVEPTDFSIRHGLVVSAPPLTHSISVEVADPGGRVVLDRVFDRQAPLPTRAVIRYRADHEVRPGDERTNLPIKLWEGEALGDVGANQLVGTVFIRGSHIERVIPEGAEIELDVRIDASRRISIDAFVPHLNQFFSENDVWLRDDRDPTEELRLLPAQVESYSRRLDEYEARTSGESLSYAELARLRDEVEQLEAEIEDDAVQRYGDDPDRARQIIERAREVRRRLAQFDDSIGLPGEAASAVTSADDALTRAQMVVDEDGSPSDEAELVLLRQEMEESQRIGDTARLESLTEAAGSLVHRVLLAQPWFWVSLLEGMRDPDREFVNRAEAQRQLNAGECAIRDNDFDGLRESVMRLWELRPKDSEEVDMERAIRSGLRRY